LRALNGALLGAVAGGLLGFGLGAASAFLVSGATGESHYARQWQFCALFGLLPGVPAGSCIGSLLAMSHHRNRGIAAIVLGLAFGSGYAWLLRESLAPDAGVRLAMAGSGLLGGLVMAALMRFIRARWSWWSRWDS
jgi:hypothetical protein